MTKKNTIIFDIGNVVIYFSHEMMFRQIAEISGLTPHQIAEEINHVGILYEEGKITTEELFNYFITKSPKEFSKNDFIQALTQIFRPNDSIRPVIESLREKKLNLLLLSNICEAHYDYICAHYPIIHHFHYPILSFQARARKPNRAIFQAALNAAKCTPSECFYTDDIPEYVEIAKSMGIDSEIFINSDTLRAQLKERRLL